MEKVQPPPRESLSGGGLPVNVGFSRANSPSEEKKTPKDGKKTPNMQLDLTP